MTKDESQAGILNLLMRTSLLAISFAMTIGKATAQDDQSMRLSSPIATLSPTTTLSTSSMSRLALVATEATDRNSSSLVQNPTIFTHAEQIVIRAFEIDIGHLINPALRPKDFAFPVTFYLVNEDSEEQQESIYYQNLKTDSIIFSLKSDSKDLIEQYQTIILRHLPDLITHAPVQLARILLSEPKTQQEICNEIANNAAYFSAASHDLREAVFLSAVSCGNHIPFVSWHGMNRKQQSSCSSSRAHMQPVFKPSKSTFFAMCQGAITGMFTAGLPRDKYISYVDIIAYLLDANVFDMVLTVKNCQSLTSDYRRASMLSRKSEWQDLKQNRIQDILKDIWERLPDGAAKKDALLKEIATLINTCLATSSLEITASSRSTQMLGFALNRGCTFTKEISDLFAPHLDQLLKMPHFLYHILDNYYLPELYQLLAQSPKNILALAPATREILFSDACATHNQTYIDCFYARANPTDPTPLLTNAMHRKAIYHMFRSEHPDSTRLLKHLLFDQTYRLYSLDISTTIPPQTSSRDPNFQEKCELIKLAKKNITYAERTNYNISQEVHQYSDHLIDAQTIRSLEATSGSSLAAFNDHASGSIHFDPEYNSDLDTITSDQELASTAHPQKLNDLVFAFIKKANHDAGLEIDTPRDVRQNIQGYLLTLPAPYNSISMQALFERSIDEAEEDDATIDHDTKLLCHTFAYITTFHPDSFDAWAKGYAWESMHAYQNRSNGVSCSKGIPERCITATRGIIAELNVFFAQAEGPEMIKRYLAGLNFMEEKSVQFMAHQLVDAGITGRHQAQRAAHTFGEIMSNHIRSQGQPVDRYASEIREFKILMSDFYDISLKQHVKAESKKRKMSKQPRATSHHAMKLRRRGEETDLKASSASEEKIDNYQDLSAADIVDSDSEDTES